MERIEKLRINMETHPPNFLNAKHIKETSKRLPRALEAATTPGNSTRERKNCKNWITAFPAS